MSTAVQLRAIVAAFITVALFAVAPLAFAENNTDIDYEAKAEAKITLVEEMLSELDEEDAAEVEEMLAEARAYLEEEEYEEAYEEAVEAYEEATEALSDEKDEDEDMDEENDDDMDDDKKRSCTDSDTRRECVKDHLKEKREAKCAALDEDDASKNRMFCRDGDWKEKRDARLDDITAGFVKAADLNEDETVAIRAEIEALIRQLIALIMMSRLGS